MGRRLRRIDMELSGTMLREESMMDMGL